MYQVGETTGDRWCLSYPGPEGWKSGMKCFKNNKQYLEFHSETCWQPMQLIKQQWRMGITRSAIYCLCHCILNQLWLPDGFLGQCISIIQLWSDQDTSDRLKGFLVEERVQLVQKMNLHKGPPSLSWWLNENGPGWLSPAMKTGCITAYFKISRTIPFLGGQYHCMDSTVLSVTS